MIYCLLGENSFMRREELAKLLAGKEYTAREGVDVEVSELPTLLAGQSLFGGGDVVVLDGASLNKSLWDALEPWFTKVADDTTLILVEIKLDKRTKTYKSLQKHAKIIACDPMLARDTSKAETWLAKYAKSHNVRLDTVAARDMVQRALRQSSVDERQTIVDQELLATAVGQLSLAGTVDADLIETVLPPALSENVFNLFESAVRSDVATLQRMVGNLKAGQQDGHQTLGLLATQASNLAAVVLADGSQDVAADTSIHPYALRQLQPLARVCSLERTRFIVQELARADEQLKSGQGDPWMLIEKALLTIALKK